MLLPPESDESDRATCRGAEKESWDWCGVGFFHIPGTLRAHTYPAHLALPTRPPAFLPTQLLGCGSARPATLGPPTRAVLPALSSSATEPSALSRNLVLTARRKPFTRRGQAAGTTRSLRHRRVSPSRPPVHGFSSRSSWTGRLLHAGAALAWRSHPLFGRFWADWVAALQEAPAQPLASLGRAVALQAAPGPAPWPPTAFTAWQETAPCSLRQAVRELRDAQGYIGAVFQEALLHLFGGDSFAARLLQSLERTSSDGPPAPPAEVGDDMAAAASSAAPRRRRRRPRPSPSPAPSTAPVTAEAAPSGPGGPPPAPLASIDLATELRRRVFTLQSCPGFLRGALRTALRQGLQWIYDDGGSAGAGWALFLLAPRMLLYRRPGETTIPRGELERRVAVFRQGGCRALLDAAAAAAAAVAQPPGRSSTSSLPPAAAPQPAAELRRRGERAAALVQLGELSAASASLTSAPLAPCTAATLEALRDPERRPPVPQVDLPPEILRPPAGSVPIALDQAALLRNLRGARRGAAPGLSGMTMEHLRVLLDEEEATGLLQQAAQRMAHADLPSGVLAGLRLGRMVALQKPQGGVRGLVMGDVFRRLVARTLAQQCGDAFQEACLPFQYALSTRAGADSLARAVQIAIDDDPRTTILSIDGVGAYDHISRRCMREGLRDEAALLPLLPYVAQFYGSPSTYLFFDESGCPSDIHQGEGGEQGDPLMPALYALGQHKALLQAREALLPGEQLYAYLDDVYATCPPERAGILFEALSTALQARANVQVHLGKTRAWNAAGEEPRTLLLRLPSEARPLTWAGNWARPPAEQGITVLGTPIGHPAFVEAALAAKSAQQAELLHRIPAVPHLQSAWLLLLFCALPRCNYLLRILPPGATGAYAATHDAGVLACLASLLGSEDGLPLLASRRAQLPLRFGGLGLRSAVASRHAAHWASWADSLPVIRQRHPELVARILPGLDSQREAGGPSVVRAPRLCAAALRQAGFEAPTWTSLVGGVRADAPPSFGDPVRGWQKAACAPLDKHTLEMLLSDLDLASRALLLSQGGPGGAAVLTGFPTSLPCRLSDDLFRAILLRRLRLPLPAAPRTCSCGRPLDALGDHRAACATTGVLVRRAGPLERAAAAICREAGGRVATNVMLRDLNLGAALTDARRLEVVAHGLPAFAGAQVAVDVTLVSPLTGAGVPHPTADTTPGACLRVAATRKVPAAGACI